MKKLLCSMMLFGLLFTFFISNNIAYAGNLKNGSIVSSTPNSNVSETVIEDGIVKRELLTWYETSRDSCEDDVDNVNYKYITMRLDVTYTDKFGKGIATAYIEANYRYNIRYKEAKCLSTSHGEVVLNSDYQIIEFARTKNMMWSSGGAYGIVNLKKGFSEVDKNSYILKCDHNGDLELVKR